MFYPLVSTYYMNAVQSKTHTEYKQVITQQDSSEIDKVLASAKQFNEKIYQDDTFRLQFEENGYYTQLLLPDMPNIMGYISIPKLNISLPIFHGVDTESLSAGCGHMPQSSLPIGGENTHTVLSAHTGMANAKMFSDLPLIKPGDKIVIESLGQTLVYEVQSDNDIQTVLPHQVQSIEIKKGEDLCTLVTCVPFGVNTHRLLVTGHRIFPSDESIDEPNTQSEPILDNSTEQKSIWNIEYGKSLLIGIAIVGLSIVLACTIFVIFSIRKNNHQP